jgi:hypothetical protein
MKVIALEETTMTVPELVRLVENEDIILTRNGQPLVSVRDVHGTDWEATSLAHSPKFAAIIQKSRDSYQTGGGISLADLRQELGLETAATGIDSESAEVKPADS